MVSKVYIYTILVLTILFWLLFGVIAYLTNPLQAEISIFLAFFITIFSALWGTITLLLFYFKMRLGRKGRELESLKNSLRQGGLFSLFLICLLVLRAFNLLSFWTGSLTFVFIFLLELVLRIKR